MSNRSSMRSRSSLAGLSSPQSSLSRISLGDFRRPPSARSLRPMSPSSRPGSGMGSRNTSSGSRPSTPSFNSRNYEPYTGNITVSIRPNPYSVTNYQPLAWDIDPESNTIINTTDSSSFNFDNVFSVRSPLTNYEVYQRSCLHIVNSFLQDGYNGTVFAYGMTGSGKTFSMRGDERDPGFVKLAIDDIFNKIESEPLKQYFVNLTYLEIYNEKIIDLLNETSSSMSQDLKIRDDPVQGVKIVGITSPTITSKGQILSLIGSGDNKRKTSATDFNARSSRSHSILQVKLTTIDMATKLEQTATLSLCDLAGSERATSSAERRKEGAYINKSLLALSTVINKLSISCNGSGSPSTDHIPYRDSKLTRLLQPALSGSSLILILCTVHLGSPSSSINQQFVSETYNTLRFAARAKDIIMQVDTNKRVSLSNQDSMKLIEELRATIDLQKNEIQLLRHNGKRCLSSSSTSSNESSNHLEAEVKILNEKLEHLTRLTDLQKTETVLLRNDALNDILGLGVDNNSLQLMMSNLEEFYKRINYEMDEYKSYIGHLEHQLQLAYEQLEGTSVSRSSSIISKRAEPRIPRQMETLLRDQEEEILHLKELIKDKDHIINGIAKTSKLRRLVDSNSLNSPFNHELTKKPSFAGLPTFVARKDKENDFDMLSPNLS